MGVTSESYLADVLSGIESESIRAWAQSERNAPIVREMAERARARGKPACDLTAWLVGEAIGLWSC